MGVAGTTWLAVAIGGALGALARYGLSLTMINMPIATAFPWATLTVNLIGCLFIGVVYQISCQQDLGIWVPFLMVGVLGGFTTFSSFGLDAIRLMQNEMYNYLVAYVLASNIIGLLAVIIGMKLAKNVQFLT